VPEEKNQKPKSNNKNSVKTTIEKSFPYLISGPLSQKNGAFELQSYQN
jgi:hypothetical protein